jgi:hypothetical protein
LPVILAISQVPMDVPKTALDMVNKFMHGQPW